MNSANAVASVHHDLARLFASDALIGPPYSTELVELMAVMFSAAEARTALAVKPYRQQSAARIARRAGEPELDVRRHLDAMADRKVIHRGAKGYCLLPLLPGVFEKLLMGGVDDEYRREVSRRIRGFFSKGYMKDHVGSPTQVVRTLPVERKIDVANMLIDDETMWSLIAAHDTMAVLNNCQCRQAARFEGDPCRRAPVEEGCLAFGRFAEFFVAEGGARRVDREEMWRAVRARWDRGLIVFGANVSPDSPNLLCACCDCCCQMLQGLIKPDPKILVTAPAFVVTVDQARCDDCGKCAKACNTDAHLLEAKRHRLLVERCVGCGHCVEVCPEEAIRPVPNAKHRAPAQSYARLALRLAPSKAASLVINKVRRSERLTPLVAAGDAVTRSVSPWLQRVRESSVRGPRR